MSLLPPDTDLADYSRVRILLLPTDGTPPEVFAREAAALMAAFASVSLASLPLSPHDPYLQPFLSARTVAGPDAPGPAPQGSKAPSASQQLAAAACCIHCSFQTPQFVLSDWADLHMHRQILAAIAISASPFPAFEAAAAAARAHTEEERRHFGDGVRGDGAPERGTRPNECEDPGEGKKAARARAAQAAAHAAVAAVRREYDVFRKVLEEDYPSVLVHRLFVVPRGTSELRSDRSGTESPGEKDDGGWCREGSFPFSSPYVASVSPQPCDEHIVYFPPPASGSFPVLSTVSSPALFTAAKEDFFLCLLKQLGALTLRAPDRCPPLLTPLDSPLQEGAWGAGAPVAASTGSVFATTASPRGASGCHGPAAVTSAPPGAQPIVPPGGSGTTLGGLAGAPGASGLSLLSPATSPSGASASSAALLRLLPARLQKQKGDVLLLGGAPAAAAALYVQAAEACRAQGDTVWQAAALEGQAAALYAFLRSALYQLEAYEQALPRSPHRDAGPRGPEGGVPRPRSANGSSPGSPEDAATAGGQTGGSGGSGGAGTWGGHWALGATGSGGVSVGSQEAAGSGAPSGAKSSWWNFDPATHSEGEGQASDAALVSFPPAIETILAQCISRRTHAATASASGGASVVSGSGLGAAGLPFPSFLPGGGASSRDNPEKGVSSSGAHFYFSAAQGSGGGASASGSSGPGPNGEWGGSGTGDGHGTGSGSAWSVKTVYGGRAPATGSSGGTGSSGLDAFASPPNGLLADTAATRGRSQTQGDTLAAGDAHAAGKTGQGPLGARPALVVTGDEAATGFRLPYGLAASPELVSATAALIQAAYEAVCLKLRDAAQLYSCHPGCALWSASTTLLLCRLVARFGSKTETLQLISSAAEKAKRLEVQDFVTCLASLAALCSAVGAFRKLAFLLHRVCMALLEAKKWAAAHYAAALTAPWYHLALLELPPTDHLHPLAVPNAKRPGLALPVSALPPSAPLLSLNSQLAFSVPSGLVRRSTTVSLGHFVDALRRERQRERRLREQAEEIGGNRELDEKNRRNGERSNKVAQTLDKERNALDSRGRGAARGEAETRTRPKTQTGLEAAARQSLVDWDLLGDVSLASAMNSPMFSQSSQFSLASPGSAKPSLLSSAVAALGVRSPQQPARLPQRGVCPFTPLELHAKRGREAPDFSLSPEDFNFAITLLRLRQALRQQHYTPGTANLYSPACYASPPPLPAVSASPRSVSASPRSVSASQTPFFFPPRPPFPVSSPASLDFLSQHQRRVRFTDGGGQGDRSLCGLFLPASSVSAALGDGGLRVWWPAVQSRVLHMLKITTEHLGEPGKVAWYACAALKILYPVLDHKTQASTIMLIQAAAGRRATPLALPPALTIVSKKSPPSPAKLLLETQRSAASRSGRKRAGAESGAAPGAGRSGAFGSSSRSQDEQLHFLGGMCKGAAPPLPLLARIHPVVDVSVFLNKEDANEETVGPVPFAVLPLEGERDRPAAAANRTGSPERQEQTEGERKESEEKKKEKKTVLMYNPFAQKQEGGGGARGPGGREEDELPVSGQWVKGELRTVQVSVRNPLGVELVLDKAKVMTAGAHAEVYPVTVLVPPSASHQVTFEVTVLPKEEGRLFFTGLTYTLNKLQCSQLLLHRSPRLLSLLDFPKAPTEPPTARGRREGPEAEDARNEATLGEEATLLEATEKAVGLLKFSAAASVEVVPELPLLRVSVEAYSAPSAPPARLGSARKRDLPTSGSSTFAVRPSELFEASTCRPSAAPTGPGTQPVSGALAGVDASAAWEAAGEPRGGAQFEGPDRGDVPEDAVPGRDRCARFSLETPSLPNFPWSAKPLWRAGTGFGRRRKRGLLWRRPSSSAGLERTGDPDTLETQFNTRSIPPSAEASSGLHFLDYTSEEELDSESTSDSGRLFSSSDEDVELARLLFPRRSEWSISGRCVGPETRAPGVSSANGLDCSPGLQPVERGGRAVERRESWGFAGPAVRRLGSETREDETRPLLRRAQTGATGERMRRRGFLGAEKAALPLTREGAREGDFFQGDRAFSGPAAAYSGDPTHSPVWEGQHRLLALHLENVGRAPVRDLRFELLTHEGETPSEEETQALRRHFQVLWHPDAEPAGVGPAGTVIYSDDALQDLAISRRTETDEEGDEEENEEGDPSRKREEEKRRGRDCGENRESGWGEGECVGRTSAEGGEREKAEERGETERAEGEGRTGETRGGQRETGERDVIPVGKRVRICIRCIASTEFSSCIIRIVYASSSGSKYQRQVLQPLSLRVQSGLQLRPQGVNIFPLVFFSHRAVLKTFSAFPAFFAPDGAGFFPLLLSPSAGVSAPYGPPDPASAAWPLHMGASPQPWGTADLRHGDKALEAAAAGKLGLSPALRPGVGLRTPTGCLDPGASFFSPCAPSDAPVDCLLTHRFDHRSCLVCLDLQNCANVAFECFTVPKRRLSRVQPPDGSLCCVSPNESQRRWALWVRRPRLQAVQEASEVVGELDRELNIHWRCFPAQEGSLKLLPLLRRVAGGPGGRACASGEGPSAGGATGLSPKRQAPFFWREESPEKGCRVPEGGRSRDREGRGKRGDDEGLDGDVKEDDCQLVRPAQLSHFSAPQLLIRPRILGCAAPGPPRPSAVKAGLQRASPGPASPRHRTRPSVESCAGSSDRTSVDEGFSALQASLLCPPANAGPLFGLQGAALTAVGAGPAERGASRQRPVRLGPDCYKIPLHEPVTLQVYVENRHAKALSHCVVLVVPFAQEGARLPEGLLWSGSLSRELLQPLPTARSQRLALRRAIQSRTQTVGRPLADSWVSDARPVGAPHELATSARSPSPEGEDAKPASSDRGGAADGAGGGRSEPQRAGERSAEGGERCERGGRDERGRPDGRCGQEDPGRRCSGDLSLGQEEKRVDELLDTEGLNRLERRGAVLAHQVTLFACVPGMFSVAVAVLVRPNNVIWWHHQAVRLIA
ncbi:hypothetical protein TGME49_268330 [Toxoplasma gondii ME49]|uniref:Trs120/TRAPPC9 first Ig-like domain-containing protein n=1 Tax=Toxoplasma gondii (strain ATCC 50611 / Me49) TaxID=508771 RepID=S8GIF5_TOXGM|nr:hypothetical protein TGME49_268330 [Toxoplasma gondii ME49]EPT28234.1 hypothetical protein TGME49_268330 [Toxoplasma gondii ME49]|eukprot:XP_002365540.1 hypothetical protein TGME49_268330 [Toxoplasma gondii ME49]